MLAAAFAYVALIALVAATILSTGLAMTRMTIARMAQPYLSAGYQRAATALQQSIAAQVQAGGSAQPAPAFTALPPVCANPACTYTASETIALTQTTSPTPGPSCDPSGANCAQNVQTNAYVGESRIAAVITVNVDDAQGAPVATRSATVLLRTFGTPPYVSLAGARDGTFDDVANNHAAGDDGGMPATTPNPCASASPGSADGTAVRVAYRNAQTNACTDGSSWGASSYSSTAGSGGWSE